MMNPTLQTQHARTLEVIAEVSSELRDIARQLEQARLVNFSRRVRAQATRLSNRTERAEQ